MSRGVSRRAGTVAMPRSWSVHSRPFLCTPYRMASERKSSFVPVDELMPQVSLDQVARFYGVELPELHRVGSETRARCFLACGRTKETGDRAIAILEGNPVKTWHCHEYEC